MSRIEVVDSTVADAVEDAFEELEELRAELSDWAFNMRQSNLGQTRKCFEVEDAEAALDLDPLDIPASVRQLPVKFLRHIKIETRPQRRDEVLSILLSVYNVLSTSLDAEAPRLKFYVDSVIQAASKVEFPRARG